MTSLGLSISGMSAICKYIAHVFWIDSPTKISPLWMSNMKITWVFRWNTNHTYRFNSICFFANFMNFFGKAKNSCHFMNLWGSCHPNICGGGSCSTYVCRSSKGMGHRGRRTKAKAQHVWNVLGLEKKS